ncbi:PhnE/PtxC family ABC transporter permease [Actinopolymorpha pittospori]
MRYLNGHQALDDVSLLGTLAAVVIAVPLACCAADNITLRPFAGVLALAVHSIGMLGRLIAEAIEDGEALPVQALTVTGANRLHVITHASCLVCCPRTSVSRCTVSTRTSAPRSCSGSSVPVESASNS